MIFCELVNEVILENQKPDFLPKIKRNNPNYEETLRNINMALNEIRLIKHISVPQSILNLRDTDLIKVINS